MVNFKREDELVKFSKEYLAVKIVRYEELLDKFIFEADTLLEDEGYLDEREMKKITGDDKELEDTPDEPDTPGNPDIPDISSSEALSSLMASAEPEPRDGMSQYKAGRDLKELREDLEREEHDQVSGKEHDLRGE